MTHFLKASLLLVALGAVGQAQTSINGNGGVKCGAGGAALMLPIAIGPSIMTVCVQLAGFTLYQTTNPPTLRPTGGSGPAPLNEVPVGAVNGVNANFRLSATPAAGFPVMVWRNGLLLTACAVVAGCTGDYQTSGTTLLFLSSSQTAAGVSAIPVTGDLVQVLYWR